VTSVIIGGSVVLACVAFVFAVKIALSHLKEPEKMKNPPRIRSLTVVYEDAINRYGISRLPKEEQVLSFEGQAFIPERQEADPKERTITVFYSAVE